MKKASRKTASRHSETSKDSESDADRIQTSDVSVDVANLVEVLLDAKLKHLEIRTEETEKRIEEKLSTQTQNAEVRISALEKDNESTLRFFNDRLEAIRGTRTWIYSVTGIVSFLVLVGGSYEIFQRTRIDESVALVESLSSKTEQQSREYENAIQIYREVTLSDVFDSVKQMLNSFSSSLETRRALAMRLEMNRNQERLRSLKTTIDLSIEYSDENGDRSANASRNHSIAAMIEALTSANIALRYMVDSRDGPKLSRAENNDLNRKTEKAWEDVRLAMRKIPEDLFPDERKQMQAFAHFAEGDLLNSKYRRLQEKRISDLVPIEKAFDEAIKLDENYSRAYGMKAYVIGLRCGLRKKGVDREQWASQEWFPLQKDDIRERIRLYETAEYYSVNDRELSITLNNLATAVVEEGEIALAESENDTALKRYRSAESIIKRAMYLVDCHPVVYLTAAEIKCKVVEHNAQQAKSDSQTKTDAPDDSTSEAIALPKPKSKPGVMASNELTLDQRDVIRLVEQTRLRGYRWSSLGITNWEQFISVLDFLLIPGDSEYYKNRLKEASGF